MKNLLKALFAFQQDVPIILKETEGYGYKYVPLPNVIAIIKPFLKTHGLGFTQLLNNGFLTTIVFHAESGERLESESALNVDVQLKGMNAYQVEGTALTYKRRYALESILGLVTTKDTDIAGDPEPPKTTPKERAPIKDAVRDGLKKQIREDLKTYKGEDLEQIKKDMNEAVNIKADSVDFLKGILLKLNS